MSDATGKRLLIAAMALPVLVFVGLVLRAEARSQGGTIRLSIVGRDPRDLLRGQYLVYRVVPPPVDAASDPPGDGLDCVCKRAGNPPVLTACGAPGCALQFQASLLDEQTELFIPEKAGPALEAAIREQRAEVDIAVKSQWEISVRELLIDGMPHRQWLRQQDERD